MDKSATSTWPDDDLQCLNKNKSPVPKMNSELISTILGSYKLLLYLKCVSIPRNDSKQITSPFLESQCHNLNSETTNLWNAFERLTRLSMCVCLCASLHNSYIIFSAANQPVWHCNHGDYVFTDGRSPRMGAPPSRNKRAQRSRKQAARSFNEHPSQLPLLKHTQSIPISEKRWGSVKYLR